jgi:amino-acid N-acetyltransferase
MEHREHEQEAPVATIGESVPVYCRAARLGDVPSLRELINGYAEQDMMLPRTNAELYENVRDFLVLEAEVGGVVGCAAVHIINGEMAELKSVAVAAAGRGHGLGRILVERCAEAAHELGLRRLFALTYQVDFFARLGFEKVDRSRLPEKVWGECVRCNKFLDCDEVAMWFNLG